MQSAAWLPVAFEVTLLVGALAVLLVAVVAGRNRAIWGPVAGLAFAVSAVMGLWQWVEVESGGGGLFFSSDGLAFVKSPMVVMDAFSALAAMILGAVGFVAFLGTWDLQVRLGKRAAEFSSLLLLGVAGLHMMTATPNLVVIFIGLETASIAFYVIAGFTTHDDLEAVALEPEASVSLLHLGDVGDEHHGHIEQIVERKI